MSHYHWGEFQTHAFHVYIVPCIGPIVSVMNLHGWKTCSREADQSVKADNGFVNGQCISVAIDDLQPKEVRHEKLKIAHMGCEKSPFCRAKEQEITLQFRKDCKTSYQSVSAMLVFYYYYQFCQRTWVAQKASLYQVLPSSLYEVLPSNYWLYQIK